MRRRRHLTLLRCAGVKQQIRCRGARGRRSGHATSKRSGAGRGHWGPSWSAGNRGAVAVSSFLYSRSSAAPYSGETVGGTDRTQAPCLFSDFFRVPSILKIRVCCILRCASAGKVPVFYMKSFLCVPKFYTKGASVYANGARQVLMLLHKGISDFLNHISKEEKKHHTNFAICSRVVSTKG